jgi:uncharacterized protein (DUF58 family)
MGNKKSELSALSSFLVSWWTIVAFFAVSVIANFNGYALISAFSMFVFLLTLLSRLWGLYALKRVSVEIKGGQSAMFVGQRVAVRYSVANDKLLPLIWLELLQDLPQNACLIPDGDFEVYEFLEREDEFDAEKTLPKRMFKKKLAFLLSYRSVAWESRFTACRRGIYSINNVELRSGDGFGLAQSQKTVVIASSPVFVIYPKIVPVNPQPLLQNLWNSSLGSKGYFDDLTVMRGTRTYQSTDSWKHINWRMAARQPQLQVKLFETVMPRCMHFIVDGASFAGLSVANDELEDALSVLASLIMRLGEHGVACGLSLPKTKLSPPVSLFTSEDSAQVTGILFSLASFAGYTARPLFDDDNILHAKDGLGQVYYLTYDANRLEFSSLLRELDAYSLTLLSYAELKTGMTAFAAADCKALHLLSLKKEAPK